MNRTAAQAFSYVVRIAFPEHAAMEAFLDWLRDVHVADVIAAGAQNAELVVIDGDAHIIEARYAFASRTAFAEYERAHAPRLRAEGLARIAHIGLRPEEVAFTRTTGEIVTRR